MTKPTAAKITSLLCCCVATFLVGCRTAPSAPKVAMSLDVSQVWAGHPVGFCLLTEGNRQYLGYYDQHRRMTVAARKLDSTTWDYHVLPQVIGWDSHNYITIAVDNDGFLHLSGNMHCNPLVYFRSTSPHDIHTFRRIPQMTGLLEDRVTYPRFLTGPDNRFLFTYRHGGSGRGDQIYNLYDLKTRSWTRLLDAPLTDGRGKMNAYFHGPVRGPDGFFHLVWVWRDTPNCYTNHDLCYARSTDMVNWQTAAAKPLTLPITIDTSGVVVDPVGVKGGIINGNTKIGFDSKNRVILSYHKFDRNGNTQLFNARLEGTQWKFYQTTDWSYRWFFEGGGAIHFEIRVHPVVSIGRDLIQKYQHDKYGSGTWKLDEQTLKPIGEVTLMRLRPEKLEKARSDYPGMQVNWRGDDGKSRDCDTKYFLRWETLGANRDWPRETIPPPTVLTLYEFKYDSNI